MTTSEQFSQEDWDNFDGGNAVSVPAGPREVRKVRGLYDLPVFGWAWTEDAKDVERA